MSDKQHDPETQTRVEQLSERYRALLHAIQSAVAFDIQSNTEQGAGADPKHLRVGVNAAMIDAGALARVCMQKGLFTEEEYLTQLVALCEEELARYARKFPEGVTFA